MVLRDMLYPHAKRYMAGKTQEDALQHVNELNESNVTGIVNRLGERTTDQDTVEHTVMAYEDLLEALDRNDVDASVSIKMTQMGLLNGAEYCREQVERLVEHAAALDRFIWIDMESSDHTEHTISLYTELREEYENIGVTIQSVLQRSETDLNRVLDVDGTVRLVKGAYTEPPSIAYQRRSAVREHYEELLEQLFDEGGYFAVATHDPKLIRYAMKLSEDHDRSQDGFAFQSIMGIRSGLAYSLAADGYRVGEYVPYGEDWYPYYRRRMIERKNHALRVLHK